MDFDCGYYPGDCDCVNLFRDLQNFCKVLLVKGNGACQWSLFQNFLLENVVRNKNACSNYACSNFLTHLEEIRCRQIQLSAIVVNFGACMICDMCSRENVHYLWDFEDLASSNEMESKRFTSIWHCRDDDFVKSIFELGFIFDAPDNSIFLIGNVDRYFSYVMRFLNPDILELDMFALEDKMMKLLKRFFIRYERKESHKRKFFVALAIRTVLLSIFNCRDKVEEQVCRFRLYFAAMPDCILSRLEVRSALYICFKVINKLHLFHIYSEEFARLMPEAPAKIQPRRLRHLARCQVRQNLKANHLTLPEAVDNLLLPTRLKKFLLSKDIDISTKEENSNAHEIMPGSELELFNV